MTDSQRQDTQVDAEELIRKLERYPAEALEGALFILQCRQPQPET